MESSDVQISKSDVQTRSRRSTRIRNAISTNESINKNSSDLRNQVDTEENEEIDIGSPKTGQFCKYRIEGASSDKYRTADPMLLNSVLEENKLNENNYVIKSSILSDGCILEAEDVLKISQYSSKSNTKTPSVSQQSDRKTGKFVLKTYCKQLKFIPNSQDFESFGLPDNPLISQNTLLAPTIDIEGIEASETTLSDVKFTDEPWEFTDKSEDSSLNIEEIRFKEHPQKLLIFGHFLENFKDEEIDENKYVFTSTPREKSNQIHKTPISVDIDLLKRNLKKVLTEKTSEHIELHRSVSSQKGKNNLVCYNSLNHDNEEVEIFSGSKIGKNPVLPNKQHKKKSNNDSCFDNQRLLDTECDTNETEYCHTSNKEHMKNLVKGMNVDQIKPIEVPRRVLRSNSLDNSQDIRNEPCEKQRKKWISVSQDNIEGLVKNPGVKQKVRNKSFPQLKVVLSPLHSETVDTKTNSIRKSLRSYKVMDRFNIDNDPKFDESLKPFEHIDVPQITPIQPVEVPKCSKRAKKTASQSGMLNNQSSDNNENFNTKDEGEYIKHQTYNNSTPHDGQSLNHFELVGDVMSTDSEQTILKEFNCSLRDSDTDLSMVENELLNHNHQLNSESSNHMLADNSEKISKIDNVFSTEEYSPNKNGKLDPNSSRPKVINNFKLNGNGLEKFETLQNGVLKMLATPQKRGRGRPRKQKMENSVSNGNSDDSIVEHQEVITPDMESKIYMQHTSVMANRISTPRKIIHRKLNESRKVEELNDFLQPVQKRGRPRKSMLGNTELDQNNIGGLVEKQSRSPKIYSPSNSRSFERKSDSFKETSSNSPVANYENPIKLNENTEQKKIVDPRKSQSDHGTPDSLGTFKRSEKFDDSKENDKEIKDYIISENISIQQEHKEKHMEILPQTINQKRHVNGWKEGKNEQWKHIRNNGCEKKQNIHEESIIVPEEISNGKAVIMDHEQQHNLDKLKPFNNKIISYQEDILEKNENNEIENQKINSRTNIQRSSPEINGDPSNHFHEREHFNSKNETRNFMQDKISESNDSPCKGTTEYESYDEKITTKIPENLMDDVCPNLLDKSDHIDDDVKIDTKLVTQDYPDDECPHILERSEPTEDEDIKYIKKGILEIEEKGQSSQENEYDTELIHESPYKHVLRSKSILDKKIKQTMDAAIITQKNNSRSSLEQIHPDHMEYRKPTKKSEMSPKFSKEVNLSHTEIMTDIRGNPIKFEVGSITWAQIGSFPFWPCLITEEPSTGIYVKNMVTVRSSPRIFYHVVFFGDKGKRAWINRNRIMVYINKNDLLEIYNKLKSEKKPSKVLQQYSVKVQYLKKWTNAVEEAESVMIKPLEERLSFFESYILANEDVVFKKEYLPARKRSRSFRKQDNNFDCAINIQELPAKKKSKKSGIETSGVNIKIGEQDLQKEKTEYVVKKKHKLSSVSQISNYSLPSTSGCLPTDIQITPKTENELSPSSHHEFKKITDPVKQEFGIVTTLKNDSFDQKSLNEVFEKSDGLEDVSVEISDTSTTESHNLSIFCCESMEAQNALFKRNNLFKGVLKEKVCQYCFISGDVLKCKGCNAVYHAGCAIRVLQELVIPRRRNRTSFFNDESFFDENKVKMEVQDKALYNKGDKCESDDEDHVQIISVPSSVYNTPPRKTFPPNFQNLTLAEQIDFKMNEVMKKFELKTTYVESSTDTSSEDNSSVHLSRRRSFSRGHNLCPSISKKKYSLDNFRTHLKSIVMESGTKPSGSIRHVTADVTLEQLISESSMVHVTADSISTCDKVTKEAKKGNYSKIVKNKVDRGRKIVTKHVTADCASFEIIDSESSNSNFSHQTKHSEVSDSTDSVKSINPKQFKCGFCTEQLDPYCFVCHQAVSKEGSIIRHKCSLYQCSRFYHSECLKLWPQTQWSLIQTTKHRYSQEEIDSFVCPQHVCHTCVSDDPRAATSRCSGDKIVKCQHCPSTYHSTSLCVPAGTEILSSTQIICPRHRDKSKMYTINTTWCFICSKGGALICCETCPTSVHPECIPQVNLNEDEKFICEECESGRLPLYDEIVWVKLGKYRWWPGLILFPNDIPLKVMNMKHNVGEFVVKFFGTYDHYWVNRGRSFLFQEGDTGDTKVTIKKKVEQAAYNKAVDEAVVVHKLKKEFKLKMEVESLNSQKPPPYIKIKVNKPVGNVKLMELDSSNTTACDCDPNKPNPCGPESDCLNRLLLTECNSEACPAGKNCQNQSFEKREYPPMIPYKTQGRGWGLKCLAPIKKGQFVIEYVGEIIDVDEYQRRLQKMHEQKEENYYFLTIDTYRMIDAGPKGNVARFMNHCCQPNCETQKWTVNGDTKVGLFATKDIPADTELTFNYNLECFGEEKKICRCGASNCSGFIGVKVKQDVEIKKPKKTYKKKEPIKPLTLPPCFICKKNGDVKACNNKMCSKAYHMACLNLTEWPEGNKFACPWHNCNTCSKRTIRCCVKCLNSFCPSHSEGNVRYDRLLGFVCKHHDPSNPESEKISTLKKNEVIEDEMAVSSTTPDSSPMTDFDDIPLSLRCQQKRNNGRNCSDSDEFENTHTKHKYRRKKDEKTSPDKSDHDNFALPNASIQFEEMDKDNNHSQDETVSGATASDFNEEIRKRKRTKSKKKSQIRKRNRIDTIVGPPATANEDINNVDSKINAIVHNNRF